MSRVTNALASNQPAAEGNDQPSHANGCGCDSCSNAYPPMSAARCGPPRLQPNMRRGVLPTVIAACAGDTIIQPGRIREMYVPEFIVWDFLARGVNFSPMVPVQAEGTKAAGTLVLTFTLPGGGPPNALIAGIVLTVGTSALVTPGNTYITWAGTFEDGSAFTQDTQWKQSAAGSSDFIQLFSKEIQGGAYPALVKLSTTGPVNLTASITNGALNTEYSGQSLSPVSDYYYWMLAYWEASSRLSRNIKRGA